MKAVILFLFSILTCGLLHSQEIDCVGKMSQLSAFVEKQEFKEADKLASELISSCATVNEGLYIKTIEIKQYNLEMASDETRNVAIRELANVYSLYDKYFSENKNGNLIKKAMLFYNTKIAENAEIYLLLNNAFMRDSSQFEDANSLYTYFSLFNDKFLSKKDGITVDNLLEKGAEVLSVIDLNSKRYSSKVLDFENAKIAVNSLLKNYLIPENLIRYAQNHFEQNKNDEHWLDITANSMLDKCDSSDVFGKIANQMHNLNPTSKSAYYIAMYNIKNRNQEKGLEYLNRSASISNDKAEKAKLYYMIALQTAVSNKEIACKMLNLAGENDASSGKYEMLLKDIYLSSVDECGLTQIQRKAVYQLALQSIQKAAKIESRYQDNANKLAKEFEKYNFTKEELKQLKKSDNSIQVDCWIKRKIQF